MRHDRELSLYSQYFALLEDWNRRINLVSRKSFDQVFSAHFVDSIFVSDVAYEFLENRPLIDIGSGAGFPGVVFACRFPEVSIRLFEKMEKRRKFLSLVVGALKLSNVEIGGVFDRKSACSFVFARAVFKKEELFKFFQKYFQPGSRFMVHSGGNAAVFCPPANFIKVYQKVCCLPENAGERLAEVFELVSRGTILR